MNNRWAALIRMTAVLLCLALLPGLAMADGAGALSQGELNAWLVPLLKQSLEESPMNAPIGEDALTEDGYAFLYSFATLYYNKPVLDEASVLKAVALTDAAFPSPRGIRVGDSADALMESFGWQNPMLLGSGSLAAFYRVDNLPEAAYWSWAQREGEKLLSVQCAIHARLGEDRYTDAGVLYGVEAGTVSSIRVYGLDAAISEKDVRGNLNAVAKVEAAISGDQHEGETAASGYFVQNDQPPFGVNDLLFGGVNYLNMDESVAQRLFGPARGENRVQDNTGETLLTTERDGLVLSYTISADGASSALNTFSVGGDLEGPRGIRAGMTKAEALALFKSDGSGDIVGGASILYGDGINAPMGLMEEDGRGGATLRYLTSAQTMGGAFTVTLHMTFMDDRMSEWMLYSW